MEKINTSLRFGQTITYRLLLKAIQLTQLTGPDADIDICHSCIPLGLCTAREQ